METNAKVWADRYAAAPVFDPSAVAAWQALADDCKRIANQIRQTLTVEVTDAAEPYATAEEMFADIDRGHFYVSRANSEHPLWTVEQNIDFRIVHDVAGHYVSKGAFNWDGEILACSAHAAVLSPLARKALETECLGQVAHFVVRGFFDQQKVAFLPE